MTLTETYLSLPQVLYDFLVTCWKLLDGFGKNMLSNPQYATLPCVIYIVENLFKGMWFVGEGGQQGNLINIMHNIHSLLCVYKCGCCVILLCVLTLRMRLAVWIKWVKCWCKELHPTQWWLYCHGTRDCSDRALLHKTTRNPPQIFHSQLALTCRERLIRSHSSARFCFELSGNLN